MLEPQQTLCLEDSTGAVLSRVEKIIETQLGSSLLLYGFDRNDYYNVLSKNKRKLDSCSRAWYITLKHHIARDKYKIKHQPLACNQRNCMVCYEVRKKKIVSRLMPLWDSIPNKTPTTHLWLTFPAVPLQDMTSSLFKFMRKKAQLFLRRLRNIKYRQWGFGCWELKYNPVTHSIHPHFHLVAFSYVIGIGKGTDTWTPRKKGWKPTIRGLWHDINKDNHNDPELNGLWYGIKGNSYIADGRYRPKKEQREGKKAYIERLRARKYNILQYFARRVANAGLITQDTEGKDKEEYTKEIIIGQLPDSMFINLIHGSRLYFSFGRLTDYYVPGHEVERLNKAGVLVLKWEANKNNKPGDISLKQNSDYMARKRTNIPKGILQDWAYRVLEIEDAKAEYDTFFLGTLKTNDLIKDSDHPPDWVINFSTLKEKFDEIFESEKDITTEAMCWSMAFRDIAEGHGYYDGEKVEGSPSKEQGHGQKSLVVFA